MKELTTYRASDRCVYQGALCSDMAREVTHTANLEKRMKAAEATASCTYFPAEGKYLVFVGGWRENEQQNGPLRELTGNFHENKQLAFIEAIQILEQLQDNQPINTNQL